MGNLFQLPQEEKNRIRGLHLTEGKDKRITSVLNEGFFAKLFGSKSRKEDVATILKDAGQISPPTHTSGSGYTFDGYSGVLGASHIERFVNFLDKLDRYFVDETKLIELIKENRMSFEAYNTFINILVASDYWKEGKKPENFLDFLVTTGKFKEGEKRQLDVLFQDKLGWNSSLSQLTKDEKEENREKHGECNPGWGNEGRGDDLVNKVDKEAYPAEWKWCQDRIDKWIADNPEVLEPEEKKEKNTKTHDDYEKERVKGIEKGDIKNPFIVKFPLLKKWPDGEEGKHYQNSRKGGGFYVVKGGKYVEIDKQGKEVKRDRPF